MSSLKDIISFDFENLEYSYISGNTYTFTVSVEGFTSIKPTITLPLGATISSASGVSVDFTNSVVYTVTAQDGTEKEYIITISDS